MSTALATLASLTLASSMGSAIVVQDSVALRAAPQDSAHQQTVLWQGEMLEVRGERLDYLQVWDHRRERGGYIRASDVRRIALTPEQAPGILSVLKFFQNTPNAEALSIGLAAAYVQAASADALAGEQGAQAMDALGTAAEGMARRAMSDISAASGRKGAAGSTGMASPSASARTRAITLTGHMDAAADYGVRFFTYENEGSMQVCYEGTAFRQLLVMPKATPEQRVRAALALTQPECIAPDLTPAERTKVLQRHAQTLDMADAATLPDYQRNRLHLRRAAIWGALAFQKMRQTGVHAQAHAAGGAVDADVLALATRALTEFSGVVPEALPDADWSDYNDAAMRVNAVRWALVPVAATSAESTKVTKSTNATRPYIQLEQGQPGQTCVALMQAALTAKSPQPTNTVTASTVAAPAVLARRCTYGVVWQASATLNKEATAMTVAVQPMEGWRELWVLRKTDQGWLMSVLPPAATEPSLGYAEWAGWIPGGQRMLVAREARGQGRYHRRTYEVVQLDSLLTEHQASNTSSLPLFQRWQDAGWKRLSLSLR